MGIGIFLGDAFFCFSQIRQPHTRDQRPKKALVLSLRAECTRLRDQKKRETKKLAYVCTTMVQHVECEGSNGEVTLPGIEATTTRILVDHIRRLGHGVLRSHERESKTTSSKIPEDIQCVLAPPQQSSVWSACLFLLSFFENFNVSGIYTEHEDVCSFWPKPEYVASKQSGKQNKKRNRRMILQLLLS